MITLGLSDVRLQARTIVRQGLAEAFPWLNRCAIRGKHLSWRRTVDGVTYCMGCGERT